MIASRVRWSIGAKATGTARWSWPGVVHSTSTSIFPSEVLHRHLGPALDGTIGQHTWDSNSSWLRSSGGDPSVSGKLIEYDWR